VGTLSLKKAAAKGRSFKTGNKISEVQADSEKQGDKGRIFDEEAL